MAIIPEAQYPGKIAPSSADYPYGEARNITLPGDGTGTPWEAALVNDLFGFQQALLDSAGVVPTGNPETATASQYLDALRKLGIFEWDGAFSYEDNEYAKTDGGVYRLLPGGDGSSDPDTDGGTNWELVAPGGGGPAPVDPIPDIERLSAHVPYVMRLPMGSQGYDGQTTHPDVIKIDGGFGPQGFPYWMGITPYVYGDDQTENPNVLASYDGLNWVIPDGADNPITPTPPDPGDFHSDTSLIFVDGVLYLYYRLTDTSAGQTFIRRKSTTDGVNWSAESSVSGPTTASPLSPTIIFEDGTYFMWFVRIEDNAIRRYESTDGLVFTNETAVSLDTITAGQAPWHVDVIKDGDTYRMILMTYNSGSGTGGGGPTELVMYDSADGVAFVKRNEVIQKTYGFESNRLYRACLLPLDESNYLVYYGAVSNTTAWVSAVFAAQLNSDGTLTPYNPNGNIRATADEYVADRGYFGKVYAGSIDVDNARLTLIPPSGASAGNLQATLQFDPNPVFDNQFIFDPGQPSRVTTPAGYTKVKIRMQFNVAAFASTAGTAAAFLHKNGSPGGVGDAFPAAAFLHGTSQGSNQYAESSILPVEPGDYFEIRTQTTGGGSVTIFQSSWFEFEFLK